jgi:hypothetical protein
LNFHVASEITYYAPKNVHLAPLGWRGGGRSFFLVGFLCFHHVPNVFSPKFPMIFSSCFSNFQFVFQYVPNMFPLVQTPQLHSQKSFECVPLDVRNNYMHYPIKFTQNWICMMYKGETKATTTFQVIKLNKSFLNM